MTKRDLVVRISTETDLIQQDVLTVVQKTLDYITEALAQGITVELRNFGVFEVKTRKARVGRNPNRPETDVPIPARSVVKFKPGKEMKEKVLQLKARKPTPVPAAPAPPAVTTSSPTPGALVPAPAASPKPVANKTTPKAAAPATAAVSPAAPPAAPLPPPAKRKNAAKPK